MSTSKPRFMVTVSDEMYQQINDYRFSRQFKSQTLAINDLIEKGLEALGIKEEEPVEDDELTEDEVELLTVPYELAEYRTAITEALQRGTQRNIQSEDTHSKNNQAE